MSGLGVLKVYFEPGSRHRRRHRADRLGVADREPRSCRRASRRPSIIRYNASNVPVAQLTVSSDDALRAAALRLRPQLHPPAALHHPRAGHARALRRQAAAGDGGRRPAQAGAPRDCRRRTWSHALLAQQRDRCPPAPRASAAPSTTCSSTPAPSRSQEFNQHSHQGRSNGATVLLGDVARVHDGYAVQTNIVRVNGRRATYLAILKKADASTLAVVDATREALLPIIRAAAPRGDGAEARLRPVGLRARRHPERAPRGDHRRRCSSR